MLITDFRTQHYHVVDSRSTTTPKRTVTDCSATFLHKNVGKSYHESFQLSFLPGLSNIDATEVTVALCGVAYCCRLLEQKLLHKQSSSVASA